MTEDFPLQAPQPFHAPWMSFLLLQYHAGDNFALEIAFFKRRAQAHGLHEWGCILRVSCLFPLSPF